jgi:HPr kinase/phosphorylase
MAEDASPNTGSIAAAPTVHATAVLVGARAVLIRGPAGAGKSRLAFALIAAAANGEVRFARLVADDRVQLEPHHGRLVARAVPTLAGLLEVRGVGIRPVEFEPAAVVGLVVDLAADDAERLPIPQATTVAGMCVPRLAVARGIDPLPLVLAALRGGPPH